MGTAYVCIVEVSLDFIIGGEDFPVRTGFRQNIDYAAGAGECGADDLIEEFRGNIDTTIGNAVILWSRSGQALEAAFLRVGGDYPMHGNRAVVVYPEHILSMEVVADRGDEAACGSGPFLGTHLRQLPVTDSRDGFITVRQAQKDRSGAPEFSIGPENEDLGIHFVYYSE